MEAPLASSLWRSSGCSDVFREFNRNIISDYTAEDINKKAEQAFTAVHQSMLAQVRVTGLWLPRNEWQPGFSLHRQSREITADRIRSCYR